MSFGFEFKKANGTTILSSSDYTNVLIDQFVIAAGAVGSVTYAGIDSSKVAYTQILSEPPSPLSTNSYLSLGQDITISGSSSSTTISWTNHLVYKYSGGTPVYTTVPSIVPATIYVYLI